VNFYLMKNTPNEVYLLETITRFWQPDRFHGQTGPMKFLDWNKPAALQYCLRAGQEKNMYGTYNLLERFMRFDSAPSPLGANFSSLFSPGKKARGERTNDCVSGGSH
jgi:hypothetical protein